VSHDLAERHRDMLEAALTAIERRGFWSAFAEDPREYPPDAAEAGAAAFHAYRGRAFPHEQPGTAAMAGDERSPYGFDLGITYPVADPDRLLPAMGAAIPAWRDAGAEARAAVCAEILVRLNARSHEIAQAVMHTTGQAFVMAFQAGGPHAQDRGLEAVASALAAMRRVPAEATWEKPQGKRPPLRMAKSFRVAPRGISLLIGCSTFPTWNSYPGLFASLVTGNPVLVKPSRRAALPLAITVSVAREVLAEAGFSPDLVALTADPPDGRSAAELAVRPEVRLIDFTGSSAFGAWLETHATQAVVFAEKSGVNSVVIESTDDYDGMVRNLAFSISLYSGQMCTTPQDLLVPAAGIETDQGHRSFTEVCSDLAAAVDGLLADPKRAAAVLGAIVGPDVLARVEAAGGGPGRVVRPSAPIENPDFPDALTRTPLLMRVTAADADAYARECFGPVSYLVETAGTAESLEVWRRTMREQGALTAGVYSTDPSVLARAEAIAVEGGVSLSINLTGGVYVNQSAAFSDYHATGLNPAASASFTDEAFVAPRFHVTQWRRHLPSESEDAGAPAR
jgi:phenylacetic acid degradation protein paaN